MNESAIMIEVFKTDISKKKVARTLIKSLSGQYPDFKINIDFDDCDKVLRIESGQLFDADQIMRFVRGQNIGIELLS
jgi:hypothetical protein